MIMIIIIIIVVIIIVIITIIIIIIIIIHVGTPQLPRKLPMYVDKKHYYVGKYCRSRFYVTPRYLNKCKHPEKCKQFKFTIACRSKSIHRLVLPSL